jgi:hypothetical protein
MANVYNQTQGKTISLPIHRDICGVKSFIVTVSLYSKEGVGK